MKISYSLLFIFSILNLLYLCIAPSLIAHNDLAWHLATGESILKSGEILSKNHWSFTATDFEYFKPSWAWDVLSFKLFNYGGFKSLAIYTIVTGLSISLFIFLSCLQNKSSFFYSKILTLFACVTYPYYVKAPDIFLSASPQIITLLFIIITHFILLRGRNLWILIPVFISWPNLHGGFLAGFVVISFFGLNAFINHEYKYFRKIFSIALLCLLSTLLNPYGLELYEYLFLLSLNFHRIYVSEWQSYLSIIDQKNTLFSSLYIVVFLYSELKTKISKSNLSLRLMNWFWLGLGLYQIRYLTVFFICSCANIAKNLSTRHKSIEFPKTVYLLCSLIIFVYTFTYKKDLKFELNNKQHAISEINFINKTTRETKVLNHWNYGSSIIFHTSDNIKLFVDGRASTAYPDNVLKDFFKISNKKFSKLDWSNILNTYEPDLILWPKIDLNLKNFLTHETNWAIVYQGEAANIYKQAK